MLLATSNFLCDLVMRYLLCVWVRVLRVMHEHVWRTMLAHPVRRATFVVRLAFASP